MDDAPCPGKNIRGEPCSRRGVCPFHGTGKRSVTPKHWTRDEHARFLVALDKFGEGRWKDIADVVGTRSTSQIQSHAQKYFLRQHKTSKQRASIHDLSLADLTRSDLDDAYAALRSVKHSSSSSNSPNISRMNDSSNMPVSSGFSRLRMASAAHPIGSDYSSISNSPLPSSFDRPYSPMQTDDPMEVEGSHDTTSSMANSNIHIRPQRPFSLPPPGTNRLHNSDTHFIPKSSPMFRDNSNVKWTHRSDSLLASPQYSSSHRQWLNRSDGLIPSSNQYSNEMSSNRLLPPAQSGGHFVPLTNELSYAQKFRPMERSSNSCPEQRNAQSFDMGHAVTKSPSLPHSTELNVIKQDFEAAFVIPTKQQQLQQQQQQHDPRYSEEMRNLLPSFFQSGPTVNLPRPN